MPQELTEEYISCRLKENYQPGVIASIDLFGGMDERSHYKCAAVLIPLVRWKKEWHLVFTHRTEAVEHHKGQVSFPGGGCNKGEATPEQTALREAEEEIGVKSRDVRLLGRLNDVLTITQFRVTPVAGVIPWPYEVHLERAEVERIFTIPLQWLADPANWREESFRPDDPLPSVRMIKYSNYQGEILWGVSAKITHNFLSVLGLIKQ